MNERLARQLLDKALRGRITFSEVTATITKEGVESYHVDFLRNECRYYFWPMATARRCAPVGCRWPLKSAIIG